MNTTKLVDTCNVEALDPTEAKAAFLSLYKQQRPWIEITNDPATLPPEDIWVSAFRIDGCYGIFRHIHGHHRWRTIIGDNSFIDKWPTHWRPI